MNKIDSIKNKLEVVIIPRVTTREAIIWWCTCNNIRNNKFDSQSILNSINKWRAIFTTSSWLYNKLDELEALVKEYNPDGTGQRKK